MRKWERFVERWQSVVAEIYGDKFRLFLAHDNPVSDRTPLVRRFRVRVKIEPMGAEPNGPDAILLADVTTLSQAESEAVAIRMAGHEMSLRFIGVVK